MPEALGWWMVVLLVGLVCFATGPGVRAENDLFLVHDEAQDYYCAGEQITVVLTVSDLTNLVNGVQVHMKFDEERVSLERIDSGDGAGSPWNWGYPSQVVEGGHLTYAVALLGGYTDADAVVARFVFVAKFAGLAQIKFRPSEPGWVNKLTKYPESTTISPQLHGSVDVYVARFGDGNYDGIIDLADFSSFVECLTGPVDADEAPAYPLGPPEYCGCCDSDGDGDVDLRDYAAFQRATNHQLLAVSEMS
ncbi:MAG: hypothetical protein KAV82_04135 [Phycisphaerae bacterium]|nr:hypothetical protein [Phycisphaerae bacterium]